MAHWRKTKRPGVHVAHQLRCPARDNEDGRCRCEPSWRGRRRHPVTGNAAWQKPVTKDRNEVLAWLGVGKKGAGHVRERRRRSGAPMVSDRPTSMSEPGEAASTILRLLRSHATVEQRYRDAIARALDVTGVEATALAYLLTGSLSPDELTYELDLSSGGTIALMQRLERRGYAVRITRQGQLPRLALRPSARLEAGRASVLRVIAGLLRELSSGDRAAIAAFLGAATLVTADAAASLAACGMKPR
jgi:hypothetical protein